MSEQTAQEPAAAPAAATPSKRSGKGKAFAGLLIVLAIVIAAYGMHWWTVARFVETTDDAYVGGNVTVISPHVSGYIAQILVKDNQPVRAGQAIIRLETHDYQAALDAAKADVQENEAALRRLDAQRGLAQSLIEEEQATLVAKKAAAEFAVLDAKRYRHLAQNQADSQQNAERSRAASQTARAAVSAGLASLQAANQQLVVIDAQSGEARAALAKAQAGLHTAQLNLGYTELRSPIDGYVGDRSIHPGTYVAAGAQLLSIVPAHGLWVDANFKEDQIGAMQPGAPVDVVADVMPSKVYHGHVQSLSPASGAVFSIIPAQNATGNFTKIVQRVPVRIALDNDASVLGVLRPGLSTTVSVNTRARPDRHSRP